MIKPSKTIAIALEIGKKRVIASALDWPGWTRSARTEDAALESLLAYGQRYKQAIRTARQEFDAPATVAAFDVVERLNGNATTDFGAPDVAAAAELEPIDQKALAHLQSILRACWKTLGTTYESAIGKELRKGPRGGGRELATVIGHVVDAHSAYLRRINYRAAHDEADDIPTALDKMQAATQEALSVAVTEGLPEQGPRGGKLWPVRYFVRRAAWHILDHVWEIEDRIQP